MTDSFKLKPWKIIGHFDFDIESILLHINIVKETFFLLQK